MTHRFTVTFTPQQKEELTEYAKRFNLSVNAFIREIVLADLAQMKQDLGEHDVR